MSRDHLFRSRESDEHAPVTYIELFFDLVFVFAITQLSKHLHHHLSLTGALEALVLFLALWWVWIYTCWVTNAVDPERGNVRLMLIALMIGGLVLSAALPGAFGATGLLFAIAYVLMQLGRCAYMVWAHWGQPNGGAKNYARIGFWFAITVPLWVGGAFAPVENRIFIWALALAIEYCGPFVLFHTPFLGRSSFLDFDISGAHMAERCALFIIISLGEAVLVTGASFAGLVQDGATWIAFLTSFIGSAAMWWIYFDIGAKRGSRMIAASGQAVGLIARNAYTYLHMPIVAGIVVTAVADEAMMTHPGHHVDFAFLAAAIGGPFLFLLGNQMFKWQTAGQRFPPLSHLVGLLLLAGLALAAWLGHWSQLTTGMAATAALIATAAWEWFSLHGGWERWAPWMGPLFRWIPRN